MRQVDLPGFCAATPANDRAHGGGAMRFAKRALARDPALIKQSVQGVYHGCFERVGRAELWQQTGQTCGHHGFFRSQSSHH